MAEDGMDISEFFDPNEKPLDHLLEGAGLCGILRRFAVIGDSLSAGEFESFAPDGTKLFTDKYAYSWARFMARTTGSTVYTFSRGGMTAREYMESYAEQNGYWDKDKACQAYFLALGVNEIHIQNMPLGSVEDLAPDYRNNKPTFAGWFGAIISRYKEISPDAKFFLITMVRGTDARINALTQAHADLMHALARHFDNCYVIDLNAHAPVYDDAFRAKFYLGGHMTPIGYALTARMIVTYVDYIIRHNIRDFDRIGFLPHGE